MRMILGVLILWTTAAAALTVTDESLWFDEAWTVAALTAPPPATHEPPRGLRTQLTAPLRDGMADLRETLRWVRGDVHPPLYFLLMDAWTALAGESLLALRMPSVWAAVMTAALLVAMGRRLGGDTLGVGAALVWASLSPVMHYAAEARMYALLMLLATASTLAYVRLYMRGGWRRLVLYGVLLALMLYTHYAAVFVVAAHGLHALITRRAWRRIAWAWLLGAVLFAGWLPVLWSQIAANPNGSLAVPVTTNAATVQALVWVMGGGKAWAMALALLIGGWGAVRGRWTGAGAVVLWLLVTPVALLTLNALWRPAYQVRYVLGALPALALLAGAGLSTLWGWQRIGRVLAVALFAWVAWSNVSTRTAYWPDKPPYHETACEVAALRDPADVMLHDIAPRDPFRYHGPRCGLTDGLAVDLSWRLHTDDDMANLAARFATQERVWVVLPTNRPKSAALIDALRGQGRTATYTQQVENMRIYRLDLVEP